VLRLYTQITGKELDLENLPEDVDEWCPTKPIINYSSWYNHTDISQGTAFFSNNVPSAKVLIGGVLCGLLDR
jgi:hypothetical protein